MSPKLITWLVVVTLLAATYVLATMIIGGDRRPVLPGKTTDAHHQIEMSCESCHGSSPFLESSIAMRSLNEGCRNCHEEELDNADDSHPRTKFRNPRMAVYWEKLDGRYCTSCHGEHQHEITQASAVTVPMDFCIACHSEGDDDIRLNRPSHAGLDFTTCASSGCHNYHDNRGLYEDFLVAHANEPAVKRVAIHEPTSFFRASASHSRVEAVDAIAPADQLADTDIVTKWVLSIHAAEGVNCNACHAGESLTSVNVAELTAYWVESPSTEPCKTCHVNQAQSFALGRHGMRQHPEIAQPRDPSEGLDRIALSVLDSDLIDRWFTDPAPPLHMTVGDSRLPMHDDVDPHKTLDCSTCHLPHEVEIKSAAVEACMNCHADSHSIAYENSPHHELWQSERVGTTPAGSGISCATCHMPKIEQGGTVFTNHNQNDNLRPNEKMIRSVCLDCHGLEFSINALADSNLVQSNFAGIPSVQIESTEWALRRAALNQSNSIH